MIAPPSLQLAADSPDVNATVVEVSLFADGALPSADVTASFSID